MIEMIIAKKNIKKEPISVQKVKGSVFFYKF